VVAIKRRCFRWRKRERGVKKTTRKESVYAFAMEGGGGRNREDGEVSLLDKEKAEAWIPSAPTQRSMTSEIELRQSWKLETTC